MTREGLIEVMARALCVDDGVDPDVVGYDRTGRDFPNWYVVQGTAETVLAHIEAAGVRLVPVEEKPGQGWLHEAVKDACLRASKNSGGTPPQLLYAPILWAMQDALTALEAAGVRLVPSEPSRHMLLAAHMVESDDIELTEDEHRAMYAAFVAASPYAPPGG